VAEVLVFKEAWEEVATLNIRNGVVLEAEALEALDKITQTFLQLVVVAVMACNPTLLELLLTTLAAVVVMVQQAVLVDWAEEALVILEVASVLLELPTRAVVVGVDEMLLVAMLALE
jgi:hypothetical protein